MRIIAIGLGGAGCRIVDSLYTIDRRGSRVSCVEGLAVDVDETTLQQLGGLPDSLKMYYPPFDPMSPEQSGDAGATATIDIAEIISRIHNFESGENDAIFVCCGLGGSMADIVPHVITGLRASIVEPIFGLVTLPCLAEGRKRSGKAADDIDILSPLLDGMILFDNETWYKKIKAIPAPPAKKEKGLAQMLGLGKEEPEISPELATYHRLNEAIVRRISLILKAGEFRADGGIDLAEVVLDSGEVLNTMKDGGFITIGYAVEKLSSNPWAFLSQLKPAGLTHEEGKKRASRIVEIAKQAIYHEISTPCDMTSAHKALVLVAGPSHELSMQGFMTVRKWIDRSIRGLETRSGDYPIMSTKNVAIIIMLSGLENIPRVNELREIREQARIGPVSRAASEDTGITTSHQYQDPGSLRDEMIVLPKNMEKVTADHRHPEDDAPRARSPAREEMIETERPHHRQVSPPQQPITAPGMASRPLTTDEIPVRRAHVTEEKYPSAPAPSVIQSPPQVVTNDRTMPEKRYPAQQPISHEPSTGTSSVPKHVPTEYSKETARQRIEQELQRQRMKALSGKQERPGEAPVIPQRGPSEVVRPRRQVIQSSTLAQPAPPAPAPVQELPQETIKKTVIIRKRSPAPEMPDVHHPETREEQSPAMEETGGENLVSWDTSDIPVPEENPVTIKDSSFRAKDDIFLGKGIRGTAAVPKARDASLMHTNLKPKKPDGQADRDDEQVEIPDQESESSNDRQRDKKLKKKDDISWI
jgi:cell division GTPase FtsZ